MAAVMYNEYFGFLEAPFSATPSSRFFYSNEFYQEALANLRYGIEWRKGLIAMSGEVGTGKTTLLMKMMRGLEAKTQAIFISYDHLTYTELLRLIASELGLQDDGEDRIATVEHLRDYLIAQHIKGRTVALLIDEAQNLSDEMFESVRFLSNFGADTDNLLQIVLTGQPELETRLDQPSLRHLKQRIVIHCRLAPLGQEEVSRYIDFRLHEAGYHGKPLFIREVLRQIAFYSAGIPRLINIICDNALLLAFAASTKKITAQMIDEVARDMGLRKEIQSANQPSTKDLIVVEDQTPSKELVVSEAIDESMMPPRERQKNGSARIPIGISLALITVGGAAGGLYSQQVKGYLQKAPARENAPISAEFDQNTSLIGARADMPVAIPLKDVVSVSDGKLENTSQPTRTKPERTEADRDTATKESKELGTFDVGAPFSFLRATPRANAKIIATLTPPAQVKVLSMKGDYFRVQTVFEGRTVRGYVHREDAFFERVSDSRQRKSRNQ